MKNILDVSTLRTHGPQECESMNATRSKNKDGNCMNDYVVFIPTDGKTKLFYPEVRQTRMGTTKANEELDVAYFVEGLRIFKVTLSKRVSIRWMTSRQVRR